ncbi:hypothetical protein LJC35_05505, partial [Parabacteroides sp. OttesenSCG-928-N08]|nr:hypothetical protein [Parabacteroides sp. OttesenSCG-928-N08]
QRENGVSVRLLFLFKMPWLTPLLAYHAGYRGLTSTATKISKLCFSFARNETRHATPQDAINRVSTPSL